MKQLTILAILFLGAFNIASAQTTAEDKEQEKEKPYIEVTGTAEKEIIPDEIYISITIRERQEGKETITIEKQEADLKAGLAAIGVPLSNLSLSDANADYIRIRLAKKDVVLKSEYLLKVGDAVTVGKVFDKLDELKILDAYIAKVSHSKIEELKKEVRIQAIKSAKDKGSYLLDAIGEKLGKPLVVNETPGIDMDMISNHAYGISGFKGGRVASGYLLQKEGEDDMGLQFQKIKLKSAIYVRFEIK